MTKVIKTPSGVIHQIAACDVCDWRNESHRYAGRAARRHTQKTGHQTWVETGTSYWYRVQQ